MKPSSTQLVLAAAVAALIVALMLGKIPAFLTFQPELATKVAPNLFTMLFVIAAASERAIAVLNDIWFGERRESQKALILAKSKELSSTISVSQSALDAQAKIAIEIARSGGTAPVVAQGLMAATSESQRTPTATIKAITDDLGTKNQEMVVVDAQAARTRLCLSFVVGLLVAFVGVRVLAPLLAGDHPPFLNVVDIILTAGVLAGGTTAINAISELLGGYVTASRTRALERN